MRRAGRLAPRKKANVSPSAIRLALLLSRSSPRRKHQGWAVRSFSAKGVRLPGFLFFVAFSPVYMSACGNCVFSY